MNRLQTELHARKLSEAREEEPEVFALCGLEVAHSILALTGIERILARSDAITNARYDQLLQELDTAYVQATARFIDAQNRVAHRAEAAMDRLAFFEEYGIDEDDDPDNILREGRYLRVTNGSYPMAKIVE